MWKNPFWLRKPSRQPYTHVPKPKDDKYKVLAVKIEKELANVFEARIRQCGLNKNQALKKLIIKFLNEGGCP